MPSTTSVGAVTSIAGVLTSPAVASPLTTNSTSTDGVDRLTLNVAGYYRVSTYLQVNVASDAATSDTFVAQIAYNNGTAVGAANITSGSTTVTALNAKGAAGTFLAQHGIYYCAPGTQMVLTVLSTISGSKTVGKYDIRFIVEQLT